MLPDNLTVFGEADPGALEQISRCAGSAVRAALMADNHKGYGVPIGGVLAYDGMVSPAGVGYDIGCGNKAVRLNVKRADLGNVKGLLDGLWGRVSFGVGRKNAETVDHPLFSDPAWSLDGLAPLQAMAREQLGTVGSGNHFVDLLADDEGYVWVGVHFGSRGLGHKTATYFLKEGGAKDTVDGLPLLLKVGTPLGDDYLEAMRLAGEYAYAGRDWVCATVADAIGGQVTDSVHNHHNYAWNEGGLWVVRKGATPAFPGQRCFVGGSMGDDSYILRGRADYDGVATINSTVHGAGRRMSRTQAKKSLSADDMQAWLEARGIALRGGGLDESPEAYKRIDEVLAYHAESVEVETVLHPFGVLMAGGGDFDPYKD